MRALLSVYDKTGLLELADGLTALGWELVSSGGTSAALRDRGIAHTQVDEMTGFPEMMDGRLKTLHPKVHGGILADRAKPAHLAAAEEHGIALIDLVVCNLYPFTSKPSVELIDIGGPTMVRSAAKNFAAVASVVDPADYVAVLSELRANGAVSDKSRLRLASKAFAHTASYDSAIANWFVSQTEPETAMPSTIHLSLEHAQGLRYGENPHQQGARYRFEGEHSWWDDAVQHGGKALSYLNVYDADAAWRLVHELGDEPAVAIIKHANPCGAALATDIATAYRLAHLCDPVSAFGGIVAANRTVNKALADALAPVFTEVLVAPGYEPEALSILLAKKNMRVLTATAPTRPRFEFRSVDGGLLVQQPDDVSEDVERRGEWRVVTKVAPTTAQWRDIELAWRVSASVSSNAIVIVNERQAIGIGAGQQNRVDSAEIAVRKAGDRARGGACGSDAFFPFRDGLDLVAASGVACIVQPGGSVRDAEVIAAADEHGIAMVFTGARHFRH